MKIVDCAKKTRERLAPSPQPAPGLPRIDAERDENEPRHEHEGGEFPERSPHDPVRVGVVGKHEKERTARRVELSEAHREKRPAHSGGAREEQERDDDPDGGRRRP